MSEMIERVAKAIYDAMDVTDGLDSTAAATYARAAIAAMREPTQEMLDATLGVIWVECGGACDREEEAKRIFKPMINAALKDT